MPNPVDAGVYGEILSRHFETIAQIIQIVAVLLGVVLLVGSLFQFKRYGEMRTFMSQQMTMAGPLGMLLASACLLSLPTFLGTSLLALWGDTSPLQYTGGTSGLGQLMPPILIFVRIVGLISIIRGVLLLSRAGHQGQPGTLGKAFTHIIAGVMCMHILGVTGLLENILDIN